MHPSGHDERRAPTPAEGVAAFREALFSRAPRLWITPALVGANGAVFVAMVASGVSLMSPSVESLLRWGADYAPRTTAGEWWRLLTNTFIHVGLVHVAMNMIGLWQIGGLVERLLGGRAFLLIYLISGLCGSLASLTWHPLVVSAGASGSVFGVYGVLVAYLVRHRGSIPRPVLSSLQKSTAFFIGLNVLFGLQQKGIDMAAHLGGLTAGFLAALVISRPLAPRRSERPSPLPELLVTALTIALVGAAVLLLPRTPDVQGELETFQQLEQRVVDSYNGALQRRQAGQLSDRDTAKLLDEQVLPPWRAQEARLAALKNVPAPYVSRLADLRRYMALREQGWTAFSQALRADDAGEAQSKANESQALQLQAEALMRQAAAAAPASARKR